MREDAGRVLLVSMPRADLVTARELLRERDTVVLPAGGPGDLDSVQIGTPVLLMASDPSGEQVPAATWRADLVCRVPHATGDGYPEGLPPSWLERHPDAGPAPPLSPNGVPVVADEDDDEGEDDEGDERPGPQSFFEVAALRELPKQEWLFVNELVGKQARGGRTFFPRVPIAVRLPD